MAKSNGNKKKNKTTTRGKGAYQSIDDGDDQPFSPRNNKNKNKKKSNNRQNKGKHDYDNHADDWGYDYSKLRKTLGADDLEIVEMEADGNCLFRSLSDQLFGDYGKMHFDVRSRVCQFMVRNKDDFQVFMVFEDEEDADQDEEDARDFEDYIENMRQQGEWGGNLEVVAAARLYRRNITVYSETMAAFTINHGESKSMGPDLLVSYHDNDHYNSVRNKSHPPKPTKYPSTNSQSANIEGHDNQSTNEIESVSHSLSKLPLEDKAEETSEIKEMKNVKRSAPCPCGSGLRYKKCCLAKQKHAIRVTRLQSKREEEGALLSGSAEGGEERSREMFRIVAI